MLTAPVLDDRRFQDIVDEAKKRIPHFCREWTDHNVSDPGVTLIELFAFMTESILYRLNQVPERHYIKFMEMLGITLKGPQPAKAPITFWLAAPQPTVVTIAAGTEVASTQTETERPIVFTTDADLKIRVPILRAIMSRKTQASGGNRYYDTHNLRRLQAGFEGIDVFSEAPQVDDALYFGFENDLSHHILRFDLDFNPAFGAGVDPKQPPYQWEVSTGDPERRWAPCDVEEDLTNSMNSGGRIQIFTPKMGKYAPNKEDFYWVRVRIKEITRQERDDGMRPFQKTPRLRQVTVSSWGGTVEATHAQQLTKEFLGRSDGVPDQRFHLQSRPILERQPGETLVVQVDGEPAQKWQEVSDFADSGFRDRHFTLDSVTGELRLGPAVRQPDGTVKLYGAIPPRGASLFFERYRYGGGQEGNVQAGILNTLKTSIPYVARVQNRKPAWGGLDSETLAAAMVRAPKLLRSRERAVTEDDFEFLAMEALPAVIGRVKCLQPRPAEAGRIIPGQIYVLVIPRVPQPEGRLEADQLELDSEEMAKLTAFLDERRLLTVRLDVRLPAYHWVAVRVRLRAVPGVDQAAVQAVVLARLYHFLNPLKGGEAGQGWPFGRDLFVSDVYQCLQGIANVQFIRSVELYEAQPGGEGRGQPIEMVDILDHGVIASGQHEVEFV